MNVTLYGVACATAFGLNKRPKSLDELRGKYNDFNKSYFLERALE